MKESLNIVKREISVEMHSFVVWSSGRTRSSIVFFNSSVLERKKDNSIAIFRFTKEDYDLH